MSYGELHLAKVKSSGFDDWLAAYLSEQLNVTGPLIDLGSGAGGYSRALSKYWQVTSVDIESRPGVIQQDLSVVWVDHPKGFRVAFSKSVLEHLNSPKQYLLNAKYCLKSGGYLVLLVPDWKTTMKVFYDDPTHVRPYTATSLRLLLEMEEWVVDRCEVFWQVPWSWRCPLLFEMARRFWWLVPDADLRYRYKHAAVLAIARKK